MTREPRPVIDEPVRGKQGPDVLPHNASNDAVTPVTFIANASVAFPKFASQINACTARPTGIVPFDVAVVGFIVAVVKVVDVAPVVHEKVGMLVVLERGWEIEVVSVLEWDVVRLFTPVEVERRESVVSTVGVNVVYIPASVVVVEPSVVIGLTAIVVLAVEAKVVNEV